VSRRVLLALTAAALITGAALPAAAYGADPGRWFMTGFSRTKIEYYQGVTSDPGRRLFFDGRFVGLYRTTAALSETARVANAIPPSVASTEGYNHIGDLTWDAAEGGRLLLPLECFSPGLPGGPNTCGTGSIAVADPETLAWRYYVKLDPADIKKAMWAEVSPDGTLVWTSSGNDLLAYRSSDISSANAAPGAVPIRPVGRLAGAVPPSGITGATFHQGRLFLAGQRAGAFQVWSIDVASGARQLEIEREFSGESEGLDDVDVLGGVLHWQIQPFSRMPTFGIGGGALLHFVPAGTLRLRLRVSPRSVVAGESRRYRFRATFRAAGRDRPVGGARIRFAGRTIRTGENGRARLRARLRPGRHSARASKRGLKPGRAIVRARSPRGA
jgi:hypothetical protein